MSIGLCASLDEALQFHQAGKRVQSEVLYRQILKQWPGQPDDLNLLSVLVDQVRRPDTAIDLIAQTVSQLPLEPDFHGNLAAACQTAGRAKAFESQRESLRQALEIPSQHSRYTAGNIARLENFHVC